MADAVTPTLMSRRRPRLLRWLLALPAAAALWTLADLVSRVELPGAALLAHLAFRAIVGPLEGLTVDGNGLLVALMLVWLGLGAAAARAHRTARRAWLLSTGAALALCQAIVVVVGCLMERASALGIAVVLLVWLVQGSRRPVLRPEVAARPEIGVPGVGLLLSAAVGCGAAAWVYGMFMTEPTGYPLVHQLGGLVRSSGVRPPRSLVAFAAVLAVPLVFFVGRRGGRARLATALATGAAASLLCRPVLDSDAAVPPLLALTLCGGLVVLAAYEGAGRGPIPVTRRLLGPCLAAALLIGGTYATRVYRCPEPGVHPGLKRVGLPDEVFRVVPGPDERFVALALRRAMRIGRWFSDTGVLDLGVSVPGAPEELIYLPGQGFIASLVPQDPPAEQGPGDGAQTNLLVDLDLEAAAVTRTEWAPVPCWINTAAAAGGDGGLYLGCEERSGLYHVDATTLSPIAEQVAPRLGDVQAIAMGHSADTLFTISLWRRPTVTRITRSTLEIEAQGTVGGTHFDLAYDDLTDRLFASAWYGSRVRVIDGQTLRTVGTLSTGFGTRALAIDRVRRLLLVSSVYGGRVQIFGLDDLQELASLPVGGHVKDFGVLERSGRAVFWSQCGLFEQDLNALLSAGAP